MAGGFQLTSPVYFRLAFVIRVTSYLPSALYLGKRRKKWYEQKPSNILCVFTEQNSSVQKDCWGPNTLCAYKLFYSVKRRIIRIVIEYIIQNDVFFVAI